MECVRLAGAFERAVQLERGSKLAALHTLRVIFALLLAASAWPAFGQTSPIYAWTNFVGQPGGRGNADGIGSAARFWFPGGVAVDSTGNLFVADSANNRIRKVNPAGVVTTLASGGAWKWLASVAVDSAGNVFMADCDNHTIWKATPGGVMTTVAGLAGRSGSADGTNSAARFSYPYGVAVDSAGNVFVADTSNNAIRKITPIGTNWVVTTVAGSPSLWNSGSADGTNSAAQFGAPAGLAVDSAGNVFVADTGNNTIRKVTPVGTNWVVTTVTGHAGPWGSSDGTGSAARFYGPASVAVDSAGNLFVADRYNQTIRQVTPVGTNWVVTTLAGSALA